jgi:hypothetical protein
VNIAKLPLPERRFPPPWSVGQTYTMNDCNQDQFDDDVPLRDDVSDDAIEAAAVARGGFPTLLYGTYCFGCPSGATIRGQVAQQG